MLSDILIRREKLGDTHTHAEEVNINMEAEMPTNQRTTRVASNHQRLGRGKE